MAYVIPESIIACRSIAKSCRAHPRRLRQAADYLRGQARASWRPKSIQRRHVTPWQDAWLRKSPHESKLPPARPAPADGARHRLRTAADRRQSVQGAWQRLKLRKARPPAHGPRPRWQPSSRHSLRHARAHGFRDVLGIGPSGILVMCCGLQMARPFEAAGITATGRARTGKRLWVPLHGPSARRSGRLAAPPHAHPALTIFPGCARNA